MAGLTNEQKIQLLSESRMIAIADFLAVDKRTAANAKEYFTLSAVVGNSTVKFDTTPETAGYLRTLKKYSRIFVTFEEFTFNNSGTTVKKAIAVDAE